MRLKIPTPRVFLPLLTAKKDGGARYKGAHGGRGSGKSHFFADMVLERCMLDTTRVVCIREVQKTIKQSVKLLLDDKIKAHGLERYFTSLETEIRGPRGSIITFQGMRDHTSASIKSLEGYDVAWCEEAQALSPQSLRMLRPTIRKPNSELWFSWNPENDTDPIDVLLRGPQPLEDSTVVQANYLDNPFLPDVLREEMDSDRVRDKDNFAHVWLGEYRRFAGGAIYGREMIDAIECVPSRITHVPYNPAFPVITAWDLGYGDATAIWFLQVVGREPRVIDYYENNMLPLKHYVGVLSGETYELDGIKQRKPSYRYETHVLPHDAGHASLRTGTTLVKQLEDLGLGRQDRDLVVLQPDSVESGIQLVRSLLPQLWFDRERCKPGIAALKRYHYEYDDERKMFKNKPHHDWSSNGADAMRYLATYLASQRKVIRPAKPVDDPFGMGANVNTSIKGWVG